MSFRLLICLMIFSINCFGGQSNAIKLFDATRNRVIPCEIYQSQNAKIDLPLVIINHGYGVKNSEYFFIANALANKGYFIISIQHDLETDGPLSTTGNLFKKRMPMWQQGVKNILFVLEHFKTSSPALNLDKIILIGHSNGGDISMMFADKYPDLVLKIISLDSLRLPFPTNNSIPILRFAGLDTKPDEGVVSDICQVI